MKSPSEEFLSCFQKLQNTGSEWRSGDLIQLSMIQEAMAAYLTHPLFPSLKKAEQKAANQLQESLWDLLDSEKEAGWLIRLKGLSPPQDGTAATTEPLSPPEPLAVPEGEIRAGGLYPDDYFDHIIRDRKMLGQLCDEVKEHMDIAQFTLVDLEFDSTNPETINKIFRAFHTIKSSAAFLGLKNLEESAHAIEDVMVLVRDGILPIDKDLINVIFTGVGLLKDLVGIIEASDFQVETMVESFRQIDISRSIAIFKKIQKDHGARKIGEILQEDGQLDQAAVRKILDHQKLTNQKFGEIAVEQNFISEDDLKTSLRKQGGPVRRSSFVKVSNERLNSLIDIVGELVVNQSMLRQYLQNPENAREAGDRTFSQLESITTNIKNLVLSMGMVPIAEIFNKLRVVIRNTAAETGKTVTVEFQGEDTELDRNVIENIYDPLVHIVRNAVDHGIESPAGRKIAGKAGMGTIVVAAEHKGNSIEISVTDNGQGIDRQAVLAKAVRQGLISEAQAAGMAEKEVFGLLMLPGFSTKEVVTEVSGRGVGMDVVQQNVELIHGKVEIHSQPGEGSQFILRIPLTLAIIDGFVTVIDDIKYIFPFNLIEEIIVPEPSALSRLENGQILLFDRGVYTPILAAAAIFGHPDSDRDRRLVIVIRYEGNRYGVAVDAILGKQEIVIKTLNEALEHLQTFSGGTIFGDGSIGFVVDIEKFILAARGEDLVVTSGRVP